MLVSGQQAGHQLSEIQRRHPGLSQQADPFAVSCIIDTVGHWIIVEFVDRSVKGVPRTSAASALRFTSLCQVA
jgi:hypothetical protein